jgi:S1-C subfamily serine protease
MKKRVITGLLILVLVISILPLTATAAGGLSNFVKVATYRSGVFSDVRTSEWYAPYVQAAYEYGLVGGKQLGRFDPDSNMTLDEAVKLAACLHSVYNTGSAGFSNGSPWFRPYADYALKNGIITSDYPDYTAPATRSEFALLLSRALPEEALSVRNTVEDNAIPDVPVGYSYSPAVYALYRAGVLTGCDKVGSFLPNNYITRAEVAAVVVRMASASFRQTVSLSLQLTKEQIYGTCAPAVFFIEIYDIKDTKIKTGSGFFIGSDGLAVTNYHVMEGAAKAVITTADGKEYDVAGIYDYSKKEDLALIKVDGAAFPYLRLADSDTVVTGASVYAIGSPMGFKNSFSAGIISSASRTVDGRSFIQTTASISSGSSGGVLLDQTGKVIGVTTATATNAQNINLALPINKIQEFKRDSTVTLQSILPDIRYYDGHFPMPDFGAYTKTPVYQTDAVGDTAIYYYKVSELSMTIEDAFDGFAKLLEQNTFSLYGYAIEDGRIISYYLNSAYGILATFGEKDYNGVNCIRVQVMGGV